MSSADQHQNPQAGAGRPLPKKEADLFKNLVKHYETKQYKKAIKHADAILRRFPDHGETLAMKGLTLNYMGKRDEAHELVKQGLTYDFGSHVCWHVYGLLYRSDRNYNEAIKAYKQSLRIDPENLQILRDLSMLQVQMRDLEGFAVTRNTLLTLKPNAKINWMAFALAKHLTGDLRGAVKVIDIYISTLTEGSAELGRCFESSELAMYKNSILAEIPNNHKEALDHLHVCEGIVVDRGAWLMKRAEYQLKLGDYLASRHTCMLMFLRGMTEHYHVHSLYVCALLELGGDLCDEALRLRGANSITTMILLTTPQKQRIRENYEVELLPMFPKSFAIQRIPLSLREGDELRKSIDSICREALSHGVPSLVSELATFLRIERNGRLHRLEDPVDVKGHPIFKMIADLADQYISCLESQSKFAVEDVDEEPPSTILWTWYLRAAWHELAGEYAEALALVEKCLEHTPTAVDVYELKARLLSLSGDIQGAVETVDKGRDLDRQDRYINNQTTKYMLQAGMDEEALKRIALFTRHEGNPEQNLYDMQCCWYELELAECFVRKQDWGRGLKKYMAVVKHFDDIVEDQFDFHSYCLRKVTLRSYVSVIRFEDEVFGQGYYCEAAAGITRIFLHLHDHPAKVESDEPDYTTMSAAERKKAKSIARKKKKAAEKEVEMKQQQQHKEGENGKQKAAQKGAKSNLVDDDPAGKEFLKLDPLDEARKYSDMLARYGPDRLETWILRYDVAIRRRKALMALQALFKARSLDPDSSELYERMIEFASKVKDYDGLPNAVSSVLRDGTTMLLLDDVVAFVKAAVKGIENDSTSSLPLRTAVAKSVIKTGAGTAMEAAGLICHGGIDSRKCTVAACLDAWHALKSFGSDAASAVQEWEAIVRSRFPNIIPTN